MIPYILADDLTGALETGAAFQAQGWRVEVPLSPLAARYGARRLTVVTTESRNLAARQAAAALRRAVRAAWAAGATLLFKKIDSTLRGPIGAELAAVCAELRPPLVVFCPANPAAGRIVRRGVLRVQGVPLAQTEFRHDPHWPARHSEVAAFLGGGGVGPVAHVAPADLRRPDWGARLGRMLAARHSPVLVGDAETQADLDLWVDKVSAAVPGALFVGSGALGVSLARRWLPLQPVRRAPSWPRVSSVLVLIGTRHPAGERQAAYLQRKHGAVRFHHACGRGSDEDFCGRVAAVLARGGIATVNFQTTLTGAAAARQIIRAVQATARPLFARFPSTLFCLTGGETAWVAFRAANGVRLETLRELSPGLVLAALRKKSGKSVRWIATKPGGYGEDDVLDALIVDE